MNPSVTIQVEKGSAGILPAPVGILPTGLKVGIRNHRWAVCDAAEAGRQDAGQNGQDARAPPERNSVSLPVISGQRVPELAH
jgi:hypothetical protein